MRGEIAKLCLKLERRHCEEPTGRREAPPDDRLRDEAIQTFVLGMDCFAQPVIRRAFARPGGSQ
jgi:hypothetical protein